MAARKKTPDAEVVEAPHFPMEQIPDRPPEGAGKILRELAKEDQAEESTTVPNPADDYNDDEFLDARFEEIRSLCSIRVDNIFDELLEQTERAETVARKHAQAAGLYEFLETEIKRRKAEIFLECKARSPKPTEKEIDAIRDMDPELNLLRLKRGTAKAYKTYMDDMGEAFTDGRASLLANLRKLLSAEGNATPR
jgi:site-specific recombinase XerD